MHKCIHRLLWAKNVLVRVTHTSYLFIPSENKKVTVYLRSILFFFTLSFFSPLSFTVFLYYSSSLVLCFCLTLVVFFPHFQTCFPSLFPFHSSSLDLSVSFYLLSSLSICLLFSPSHLVNRCVCVFTTKWPFLWSSAIVTTVAILFWADFHRWTQTLMEWVSPVSPTCFRVLIIVTWHIEKLHSELHAVNNNRKKIIPSWKEKKLTSNVWWLFTERLKYSIYIHIYLYINKPFVPMRGFYGLLVFMVCLECHFVHL